MIFEIIGPIDHIETFATGNSIRELARLKKFYGYLIGDTVNRLRMAGYTKFPTGQGYFRTSRLQDPENDRVVGELYEEMLFFDDVVDRARKRIGVYKDRLSIDLSRA